MARITHVCSDVLAGAGFSLARLRSPTFAWAHVYGNQLWLADVGFAQFWRVPARTQVPIAYDREKGRIVALDGDVCEIDPVDGARKTLAVSEEVASIVFADGRVEADRSAPQFLWTLTRASSSELVSQICTERGSAAVVWLSALGDVVGHVVLSEADSRVAVDRSGDVFFSSAFRPPDHVIVRRDGSVVAALDRFADASRLVVNGGAFDPLADRLLLGTAEGLLLWSYVDDHLEWLDHGAPCRPAWGPDGDTIVYSFGASEARILNVQDRHAGPRVIARLSPAVPSTWNNPSNSLPVVSSDGRFVVVPLLEPRDLDAARRGLGPVVIVADLSTGGVMHVDHAPRSIVWVGDEAISVLPSCGPHA